MKLHFNSLKTEPMLDKLIREESVNLFDLNIKRRRILYVLGRDGPSNDHYLQGECKIKKSSIERMIRGIETKSKSLINQGYVVESLSAMFRNVKGRKEHEHSLTVKGLLASFHKNKNIHWEELKFEDHYLMRKIRNVILQLSNDNITLAILSILFIKYNVALFMKWHTINKLDLSIIDDLYIYFENWNSTNPLLNPKGFYPIVNNNNKKQNKELLDIRDDFFAISCILDALLKQEKNSKKISQYIRKWVRLAETLRDNTYDKSMPSPFALYPGPIEGEFVNSDKIKSIVKRLFEDNNIHSSISKTIPNLLQK